MIETWFNHPFLWQVKGSRHLVIDSFVRTPKLVGYSCVPIDKSRIKYFVPSIK